MNDTDKTNQTVQGISYGFPTLVAYVSAPLYMILPVPTNIGRDLLMDRHAIGVARTLPIVGTVVALFTPEYDASANTDALQAVSDLGTQVSLVASGVATLTNVTDANERARIKSEAAITAAIDYNSNAIQDIRSALTAGITLVTRQVIQAMSGVSIARSEAAMLVFLSKQERITQEIANDPIAQKLMKLAMFCRDNNLLCLDRSEDNVTFYATSWLYAWGDTGSGTVTLYSLFSRITVFRRPSAKSFTTPGDSFFYRYKVTPIMVGSGLTQSATSCNGTVNECAAAYVGKCRNDPGCYFEAAPYSYNHYQARYEISNLSSPFRSQPYIYPQDCNSYISNHLCCGGICAYDCNHSESNKGRACVSELDILGARPTTIWLPPGAAPPYTRSMEDLGATSVPLAPCIIAGGETTDVCVNGIWIPRVADFMDPYSIGLYLFKPRVVNMTAFMSSMLSSANYQDNTGMAVPGPMVTFAVGQVAGSNNHVIMNSTHVQSSVQILNFVTGGAMYSGWIGEDGCTVDSRGIVCKAVMPGPIVSSIPFIKGVIDNLTPSEYRPRTLYDSYQTINGTLTILAANLKQYTIANVSDQVLRINSAVNDSSARLTAIQIDMANVKGNVTAQQAAIASLIASGGDSSGTSSTGLALLVLGCVFGGILLLCVFYFCASFFMRNGGITAKSLSLA
jgi:hypothetical protein